MMGDLTDLVRSVDGRLAGMEGAMAKARAPQGNGADSHQTSDMCM